MAICWPTCQPATLSLTVMEVAPTGAVAARLVHVGLNRRPWMSTWPLAETCGSHVVGQRQCLMHCHLEAKIGVCHWRTRGAGKGDDHPGTETTGGATDAQLPVHHEAADVDTKVLVGKDELAAGGDADVRKGWR